MVTCPDSGEGAVVGNPDAGGGKGDECGSVHDEAPVVGGQLRFRLCGNDELSTAHPTVMSMAPHMQRHAPSFLIPRRLQTGNYLTKEGKLQDKKEIYNPEKEPCAPPTRTQ